MTWFEAVALGGKARPVLALAARGAVLKGADGTGRNAEARRRRACAT